MKTMTIIACALSLTGALVVGCATGAHDGDSGMRPSKTHGAEVQQSGPKNRLDDRLDNAFPPTISDARYHEDSWLKDDCLRCHETGVGDAPTVVHSNMTPLLLRSKCRTCHVKIPGSKPSLAATEDSEFEPLAFPPMIPASSSHKSAWTNDCLFCHEDGTRGATVPLHKDMPRRLMKSKCRTCHVQVRALDMDPKIK